MAWRSVSLDEARHHKRYGVGGFLLVLMILIILGIALNLFGLLGNTTTGTFGDTTIDVDLGMRPVLLIVSIVLNAIVVFFAFSKHPKFPTIAIGALWIGVVVSLISFFMPIEVTLSGGLASLQETVTEEVNASVKQSALIGLIVAAVIAALVTWYLRVSARVNVTYLHRVQD